MGHVGYQPLAHGLALRFFFGPYVGGNYNEGLPRTDVLRPFLFGATQDFRQTRLGLGDGPNSMGC